MHRSTSIKHVFCVTHLDIMHVCTTVFSYSLIIPKSHIPVLVLVATAPFPSK